MNVFVSILFWAGIVCLVDGSCGLLFEPQWRKLAKGLDIRRIAAIEIGVALALLAAHYLLLARMR